VAPRLARMIALRVKGIFVGRLFGRFDYAIPMNLDERITIIHGPNGFGKTVLLRMVAGLFNKTHSALLSVPYSEFKVDFDNGDSISVFKVPNGKESNKPNLRFVYRNASGTQQFTLKTRPDKENIPIHLLDEMIPELEREGPTIWRNLGTGELLSVDDVIDRYADQLPMERVAEPDWLKAVRLSVPVRLIHAERLQTSGRPLGSLRHRVRHGKSSSSRAVMMYSEELGAMIQHALTEYATLSQSLDRTFPARVFSHESPFSTAKLPRALAAIEAKRARLVEAGLLEKEGQEPPFGPQLIDETKLPVLAVYVQDAEKKLSVFDELVAKTELFKNSINARFQYKQVSIGKGGFRFVTAEGDPLNPVNLSSGEQHEVVLLYELLFRATENSLILLDEPEISLHVAWQEQFLTDLSAITGISRFDALVATHSPQIISDRWDLTVELKGPANEVLSDAAQRS
jgi:energy-coupling factor transporter ATP-binding protein EcfA2